MGRIGITKRHHVVIEIVVTGRNSPGNERVRAVVRSTKAVRPGARGRQYFSSRSYAPTVALPTLAERTDAAFNEALAKCVENRWNVDATVRP